MSTPLLALKLDWFAEAPAADWPLPLFMTTNHPNFSINSIGEPAYFTLFKEFTRLQKLSELFVPFNTRSYECLWIWIFWLIQYVYWDTFRVNYYWIHSLELYVAKCIRKLIQINSKKKPFIDILVFLYQYSNIIQCTYLL